MFLKLGLYLVPTARIVALFGLVIFPFTIIIYRHEKKYVYMDVSFTVLEFLFQNHVILRTGKRCSRGLRWQIVPAPAFL